MGDLTDEKISEWRTEAEHLCRTTTNSETDIQADRVRRLIKRIEELQKERAQVVAEQLDAVVGAMDKAMEMRMVNSKQQPGWDLAQAVLGQVAKKIKAQYGIPDDTPNLPQEVLDACTNCGRSPAEHEKGIFCV